MDKIFDSIKTFSGNGSLVILLLAGVMYLGFSLKKSGNKTATVWYPVYVLIIFFCPLWNFYIGARSDGEILYRLLWMIPFSVITCYALVELTGSLPKKVRPISFALAVLLIMLSGKYIYSNEYFSKAENPYHVPDTVVKICDEIKVPGREVMACMPVEMIQYVRQYSPTVCLTYGRMALIYDGYSELSEELFDQLSLDEINTDIIVPELKNSNTAYFVVDSKKTFTSDISEFGYEYVKTIDGYDIYLDKEANLGIN